jgi:FkbM family methyltransferase
VLPSYAQNAEDIRIWRVLGSRDAGFYVDVGAGHPVIDSVTKLFYDHGWSGINIEPGPAHAELQRLRARDVNIDVAISATPGTRTFWVSTPDSGLSSFEPTPPHLLPAGFRQVPQIVNARRLDDVVARHARGRQVDFLKIDVEGAERDVLESFDLAAVRPTVLVVESVSPGSSLPTQEQWEGLVLAAGFVFAAFDGVNRFYVPRDRADLIKALEYPISVLDRYVQAPRLATAAPGHDFGPWSAASVRALEREAAVGREATSTVAEMRQTLSWRITRPLRSLRRVQRRRASSNAARPRQPRVGYDEDRLVAIRLDQIRCLVEGHEPKPLAEDASLMQAIGALSAAVDNSALPTAALAWLILTAAAGRYPDEGEVGSATRSLRMDGCRTLLDQLAKRNLQSPTPPHEIEIVSGRVVVDVAQVVTSDYHTGIQRVARELISNWSRTAPAMGLVHYDAQSRCLRLLRQSETERLSRWRDELDVGSGRVSSRVPALSTGKLLVPWRCHVIVPELPEPGHGEALSALKTSGVCASLSVIAYDLVPVVAPETTAPEMPDLFCRYLSVAKRADKVSAISRQSARDFEAFKAMLAGEGLHGPEVQAHPLPTAVPAMSSADLEWARSSLGLQGMPLILVVGAHDPRKNHLVVLEAAERLWREGQVFELLFIGGGGWRTFDFERYVNRLSVAGWPVSVHTRVSERLLWSAYSLARFTVFPSLLEGFGLPVAESLAVGTPVLTSWHGSMAELAADGGAVLVDPRDVEAIAAEMRALLIDDHLLARLRSEARQRDFGSWERHARDVWSFFVPTSV